MRKVKPKPGFPVIPDYVHSAACFFCAAFYGKNDVAHVRDRGIKDVLLVDNNADKMKTMSGKYPGRWQYMVGDVYEVVKGLPDARYDLVICDQWTSQMVDVLGTHFVEFYRVAGSVMILGLTQEWYTRMSGDSSMVTAGAVQDLLESMHGRSFGSLFLVYRSALCGGCWWVSITK